ncbi:MAG TPA: G8 domain-containing protein [Polyangiaceae bacterium]|nr:G8 domain-containing protein [Polyangiaceae bacterium]
MQKYVLACAIGLMGCGAAPTEETNTPVPQGKPWSDPESWPSGHVPTEGEDVVVPQGKQILLDVSPPPLGTVTLDGTLVFDDKDLEFTAEWIMVHGTLRVGHPERAYSNEAVITLTGKDGDAMDGGTRGIMAMNGGTIDLHGKAPKKSWTKLNEHLPAGETQLTLLDDAGWKADDRVVIAPTDYYRIGPAELGQLASADGAAAELTAPLEKSRWGLLQYVDQDGITLEPTSSVTEQVIDERAEVGNLTRNILIQGADDDAWKNDGIGAHVMVMKGSVARIDAVELHRVGQLGKLARYPIHWHLLSYEGDDPKGTSVKDQYVRNSAIWESKHRCVVLHATNGVTVADNVCYDILGHAIFLENAVERGNVIERNLVLHVRKPPEDKRLVKHDDKPAGFWLTNPDNVVRANVAADSEGMGFWMAFPEKPLGVNSNTPLAPHFMQFGEFSDNVAHSNYKHGLMFDDVPTNDEGDLTALSYNPSATGDATSSEPAPYTISGMRFYKHEATWQDATVSYWNRTRAGTFDGFVTTDFNGTAFAGASICTIRNALVVGWTLNNENEAEIKVSAYRSQPGAGRVGAASYHSDCEISDNLFVNLPAVTGHPSGAFGSWDYYHTGVDKGLINNPNNRMINAHPGFRSESPNRLAVGEGRGNYSLAGALWDPHGYWGAKGDYWVYDDPFLTFGTTCSAVLAPHGNDRTCKGPYYGIQDLLLDGEDPYNSPGRNRPVSIERTDNDAVWFVDDGDCTPMLGGFRSFSAVRGGSYGISFPAAQTPGDGQDGTPGSELSCDTMSGATPPGTWVDFSVTNLIEPEDWFIVGVPFDGGATPTVLVTGRNIDETKNSASYKAYQDGNANWKDEFLGDQWHPVEPAANLDAVEASAGDKFWHDTANDIVWIKMARMHIAKPDASLDAKIRLYESLNVRVRAE